MMSNSNNFKSNQNAEIINCVYRNAQMAYESTADVLKHCRDSRLAREITAQQQRYRTVATRAKQELAKRGIHAEQVSPYAKTMAKMGIAMQTARNPRSANIARIMFRGTTMGIIDMQHTINRSHCADSNIRAGAEELLAREQDFCDHLKRYL
ncbi:MAG: hypothetical protein ACI4JS_09505 [Oscillospiraceae bacterium]